MPSPTNQQLGAVFRGCEVCRSLVILYKKGEFAQGPEEARDADAATY